MPKKVRRRRIVELWVKRCEQCGGEFEAKRQDARLCGAACRMAVMRARNRGIVSTSVSRSKANRKTQRGKK